MAYSEQHARIFREALSDLTGVTEKKMFGGICFLLNGNMLCGVAGDGGMARVGKEQEAAALEWGGVDPCSFTGRPMGGVVELTDAAMHDDETVSVVVSLARAFVGPLPAKSPQQN